MAAINLVPETDASPRQVLLLEAPAGSARKRWIEDSLRHAARSGARTFHLSCRFDEGGPWAGVSGLFAELFPEIQESRPDLAKHHSLELVYAVPQLRKYLTVSNPTLTDLSSDLERVRSYPADRAFRTVQGLIDLLDQWKTGSRAPDAPWAIACDGYDEAGAMNSRFFSELVRRRGESLNLSLIVAVDKGKADKVLQQFRSNPAGVSTIVLDVPADAPVTIASSAAAAIASKIEEQMGQDRIETQIHLSELIRMWGLAGRPDKILYYRWFGLDAYNTLGLYADALRYADGLLEFAFEHAPDNKYMQWSITVKILNAYIGLQDVDATLKLAEGAALKLAEPVPAWRSYLFYMLAMLYARYQKPRNLTKGEDYLDRGLAALEEAELPEDDIHFHSVFNRNGLAMVRNFQGRHLEAIELCRTGLERLNIHLSADKHRLHRSVLVYNIGQVYLAIGDHDEALKHYANAIAMDPNYSEYYNERGSIFLQMGQLEDALANYLKAIELSPPYFEVFTNLGQCYRRMGKLNEAIESYSRALDLEPNHVLALLGRAKAYEESGNGEKAIADYTLVLGQDPSLWEAFASRGVLHYESGNLHASLADLDRALELKPDRCELYENRATVLLDLCRAADAAHDLKTAIDLAPSEPDKAAIVVRLQALQQSEESGKVPVL